MTLLIFIPVLFFGLMIFNWLLESEIAAQVLVVAVALVGVLVVIGMVNHEAVTSQPTMVAAQQGTVR